MSTEIPTPKTDASWDAFNRGACRFAKVRHDMEQLERDLTKSIGGRSLYYHMVAQLQGVLATAGAPEFDSDQHAFDWATETAKLRADLTRVTAERDDGVALERLLRSHIADIEGALRTRDADLSALRARVAELEKQNAKFERLALGSSARTVLDAWIAAGGVASDPALGHLQAGIQSVIEERNAELVAALTELYNATASIRFDINGRLAWRLVAETSAWKLNTVAMAKAEQLVISAMKEGK